MAQSKRSRKKRQDENFFEALGTTASRYQYRDEPEGDAEHQDQNALSDAKLTAIVTLILVLLVAITMGILMLRGLQTIKGTIPANSPSSGSIQL